MTDNTEPRIQFTHEDVGYCRMYYKSKVSGNIFCFQEEVKDSWLFYICSADDWGEPINTVTPPPYVCADFKQRMNREGITING